MSDETDDDARRAPVRQMSPARAARNRDEERSIIRAAYRLIGRPSAGPTTVHDILTEAGLSTRAFYRLFRSKDELIVAMCRAEFERLGSALSAATSAAAGPREALQSWIDQTLAAAYDPKRAARSAVLSSPESRATPGYREVQREGMETMRRILADLLRSGRDDGSFPNVDPDEDARAILAVVLGLIEARLVGEPGPTLEVARRHTLDLCLRAFGAVPRWPS